MKHIKALALKFIATFVLLFIVLGIFYDMSVANIFLITIVLGAAAYLLGDLLILSRTNNTMAAIVDFVLAFFMIWLMGERLTYGDSLIMPALISAAGITIFEIFFHRYLADNVFPSSEGGRYRADRVSYQTEASEEFAPYDRTEQDEKQ